MIVAVVGPTATGKSDLGVALARELDGEVINADAMQLYRGMDIGTAKLTSAERRGVPHHLLDVLAVTDEASLAAYQRAADAVLTDVLARRRVPVLVGGSGLYLRAALDHLDIPPTDPEVRARLATEADRTGGSALHERLRAADPVSAARIPPGNVRRVVRALEVIELTGRPFSASLPEPTYRRPTLQLGLRAPRDVLDRRVTDRVRRMWRRGLLAEVERLARDGLRVGRTASRALGYAQALAQLDGSSSEAAAQEETARLTRRLVRRQESWFGRDARIHWLGVRGEDPLGPALAAWTAAGRRAGPDPDER